MIVQFIQVMDILQFGILVFEVCIDQEMDGNLVFEYVLDDVVLDLVFEVVFEVFDGECDFVVDGDNVDDFEWFDSLVIEYDWIDDDDYCGICL